MPKRMVCPASMTAFQKEMLDGSLLGDGCLQLARPTSKLPRFRILRSVVDIDYLRWQFNIFSSFCMSGVKTYSTFDKRTNKTYYSCYFATAMADVFLEERKRWYVGKLKIIPRDIQLTPQSLAIWFCDDGCFIKKTENNFTIKLATQGFSVEDVEFIATKLSTRYNEKFDESKPIIKASTKPCLAFMNEINPYIPSCMPRKKLKTLEQG